MDNYPILFVTWLRDEIEKSNKDIERIVNEIVLNPDNKSLDSILHQTVGRCNALLSARHRFDIEMNQKK